MGAIYNEGKVFSKATDLLAFLEGLQFGAWRPRFVTMHHTGSPSLKVWQGWQTRAKPVTDEQWLKNLAGYYGNTMKWSAGPHFFFTPTHFCVLSPPTRRGVHAVSFNASSWGVECVGDFDTETMTPELQAHYTEGLACLFLALGTQPDPYEWNARGLHFHRDDPKTNKTCPGRPVRKETLIPLIRKRMLQLSGVSDAPAEQTVPGSPQWVPRVGKVSGAGPSGLNVRAGASAKTPVVGVVHDNDRLDILGEEKNGETLWLRVQEGYVAARFVKL